MLEQLTWPIVFALFPSRKPDASPLDPDCTIRACNKACKAGLFVFFQAGCANGNDPRLRHYAAKCPPYLSFWHKRGQGFSALVFDSTRKSPNHERLKCLGWTVPSARSHALEPATCAACLFCHGWACFGSKVHISKDSGCQAITARYCKPFPRYNFGSSPPLRWGCEHLVS
jgi:hypothetical protein